MNLRKTGEQSIATGCTCFGHFLGGEGVENS